MQGQDGAWPPPANAHVARAAMPMSPKTQPAKARMQYMSAADPRRRRMSPDRSLGPGMITPIRHGQDAPATKHSP
jgi:hypothetical protein